MPDRRVSRIKEKLKTKTGVFLIMVGLGLAVVLTVESSRTASVKPTDLSTLERPPYGDEDQTVELEVTAENGQDSYAQRIEVVVPAREPKPERVLEMLEEAEAWIREYFKDYAGLDRSWPDNIGAVEVVCRVEPEDSGWFDFNGRILWNKVKEPVTVPVEVVLTAYGQTRILKEKVHLTPKQATVVSTVQKLKEDLEEGAYLKESRLDLPKEGGTGIRFRWTVPGESRSSRWLFRILWLLALPSLAVLWMDRRKKDQEKKRRQRIYHCYPEMLNKLIILLGSGVSLVRAWERILSDYQCQKELTRRPEPLYEEMRLVLTQIRNGYSLTEAITLFADRIKVKEVRQFSVILLTGWRRGDSHILMHLKDLHDQSWDIRKKQIRKLSEEADTKLLLPLLMMLIVVMIIVLSPALMTMRM